MDVSEQQLIDGIKKLVELNRYLVRKVTILEEENARLRDENSKLLIDIAFFDNKLPKENC
jgi:hypothetical protein